MEFGDDLAEGLLEQLSEIPDWMEQAACADTSLDPFCDEEIEDFKLICNECPVRQQCEAKFGEMNESVRPIAFGVFHGENYGE